jgi:hypothetical protein
MAAKQFIRLGCTKVKFERIQDEIKNTHFEKKKGKMGGCIVTPISHNRMFLLF